MEEYKVYMHITPNNKRYIGVTKRKPEYRWNRGKAYINNQEFYNDILLFGWDNIEHVIVWTGKEKATAYNMERELIKKYNTTSRENGYNHSTGGTWGGIGVEWNDARREKMRSALTGKRHTEEAKKKMSEWHKGKPTWNKGRSWTDSEKEIMARAQAHKSVLCVETGEIYLSARDAERKTGINRGSIKDCCHGRKHCKTAGGYHWEYVKNTLSEQKTDDNIILSEG